MNHRSRPYFNLCFWIASCLTGCIPLICWCFYWWCNNFNYQPKVIRIKGGVFDSVKGISRGDVKVIDVKHEPNEGITGILHACITFWNSCCCCPITFTEGLTLNEAISRYEEIPNLKPSEVIKEIAENKTISVILEYMNYRRPKFFFRILPSGSIREGFGQKSTSTSVLATDYDLMLVPDGIFAYDVNSNRNDQFPATFVAVDDPNQNPDRPTGYLWLEFQQKELEAWKELCYERLASDGVKYYLAQLAVLKMISKEIGNEYFIQLLKYIERNKDTKSEYTAAANLTGPALNITITRKTEKGSETKVLDADFTLAIRCPDFPKAGKYFFDRRTQSREIYWPSDEIVSKIEGLGCHVVPKRSESKLTKFQEEQMAESYLGSANCLEWRYSFSQAEMLLSDHIPYQARIAYLAFKATIKVHINRTLDFFGDPHSMQSYALKSILFYEVERQPPEYWNDNDLLLKTKFFHILVDSLFKAVEEKHCPHYWIQGVNLFAEFEPEDYRFFAEQLTKIKQNPVNFVSSEWLEWNRIIRKNFCDCCVYHGEEYRIITEAESESICSCCKINCSSATKMKGCCNCSDEMEYDSVALDVY